MNEHLGGAYPTGDGNTIMEDVWGFLAVRYDLKSVLDVGCAYGHALLYWSSKCLCQIKGIEGDPACIKDSLVPGHVILHDFTTGPAPIAQPFDLCWCAEFVEHVREEFMPNYMKAFQLCRHVVMTHAEPGQAGHHHVNCQSDGYWVKQMSAYGFQFNRDETELLRRTDRWRAPWGRRSLMSFSMQ